MLSADPNRGEATKDVRQFVEMTRGQKGGV